MCTFQIEQGVVRQADEGVVFLGIPTTPEQRAFLRSEGYVHITGLRVRGARSYLIGEKLQQSDLGTWGMHNGKTVIITPGGEVWLLGEEYFYWEIRSRIGITGEATAFVPLAHPHIESVDWNDIISRVADPSHGLLVLATEGDAA